MKIKQLAILIPSAVIVLILALIPFHAFLTVWGSSIIGHYTALRLWEEFLVAICLIGAAYIAITDRKIRETFTKYWLFQLIGLFLIVELIWGLVAHHNGSVNTKALFYGWLSDCRYLVFFLITLIIGTKTNLLKNKAIKLVLWPAAAVILFGLLQIFVLPRNFLSHFGYGPNTIAAFETINHNKHFIRIASTLRGANPLGAYLIIPLTLASVILVRYRKYVWQLGLFIFAGLIVMAFSFSRSAWIGLVIAIALTVYLSAWSKSARTMMLYIAAAIVIIAGGLFIVERNNIHFQNIVFHYQKNSSSPTGSDQNHSSALKTGIKQVLNEPLGRGPGTAGPASVYNSHRTRDAENYYIQIGQETGWFGLALFIAINVLIVLSLWVRRADTLSLALLASFIGLIACNMLLPAWTDDTLCYLWWGLAGIAIAIRPKALTKAKNRWVL